uniref:Large ribosomal subunit protein uL22c n=1 Tax=Cryptoglena skujai TaxID=161229 RepID=A0A0G3SI56_9EUGL|nr:ribosomal protein L22 [Cryptoglena skujai]AKL39038.1 ribosomal protein L22 [Cryptoglena skujai]
MNNLVVNQASAYLKYVRVSPFKLRRVLDQIRGRSYNDAILILKFMPYKSCTSILKVLNSAASNAKFKFNTSPDKLFILEARVDSNSFLKRFRPHAQGRGFPIKKRMSNIVSVIIY